MDISGTTRFVYYLLQELVTNELHLFGQAKVGGRSVHLSHPEDLIRTSSPKLELA